MSASDSAGLNRGVPRPDQNLLVMRPRLVRSFPAMLSGDEIKNLKESLSPRIDDRMQLLLDPSTFEGVVDTLAEREIPDAVALMCQAVLVVAANPALTGGYSNVDMIVYVLHGPGEATSRAIRDELSSPEREAIALWLKALRETFVGKICLREIDAILDRWQRWDQNCP